MSNIHMITGAFGYSGRHIAQQLLARGHRVLTRTGHPHRPHPFGGTKHRLNPAGTRLPPKGTFASKLICPLPARTVVQTRCS